MSPSELQEPAAAALQRDHYDRLNHLGDRITSYPYPYHFYLSRVLDLDEKQQIRADQRSIHFGEYAKRMMLQITGNYYAAYSADKMNRQQRVRRTFQDVVEPILRLSAPEIATDARIQGIAVEVSHHVRKQVMSAPVESPENVVFVLPSAAALRLVQAADDEHLQAALLEGKVFLDGEPMLLWVNERKGSSSLRDGPADAEAERTYAALQPPPPAVNEPSKRDPLSPSELAYVNSRLQPLITKLVASLGSEARLTDYAPPTVISFHDANYLEISLHETQAVEHASRYKLAALAFDDNISHLIRPLMAVYQPDPDLDGIAFSTVAGKADASGDSKPLAIEYFIPVKALECYARYDCTGQKLIDESIVLVNDERIALQLDVAEGRD